MKKAIILTILLTLFSAAVSYAERGTLGNVFASWLSISPHNVETVIFPYNSRDLQIINNSGQTLCIAPTTGSIQSTIEDYCYNTTKPNEIFQLTTAASILLSDFSSSGVSIKNIGNSDASPVTIVVTY